jgi:hypothetical protein
MAIFRGSKRHAGCRVTVNANARADHGFQIGAALDPERRRPAPYGVSRLYPPTLLLIPVSDPAGPVDMLIANAAPFVFRPHGFRRPRQG